jgi:hypothetical protein
MNSVNTGWVIGGAILVLLVGLSYFSNGSGAHHPPKTVTQQK